LSLQALPLSDNVHITDDEVRTELLNQGYTDLPPELFQQFKNELQRSIRDAVDRGIGINTSTPLVNTARSLTLSSGANCSAVDTSQPKRTHFHPNDNSSTCYSTPCASHSETIQRKTKKASAVRTLPGDADHSGSSCYSTPAGSASKNEASTASAASSDSAVNEPRVMHRKVLRCRNGHAYISEHSTISSGSSGCLSHFAESFKENSNLYQTLPATSIKPPPEAVQGKPILKDTLKPRRASILSLLRSSGTKVEWEQAKGKCDPVTRYHEYKAAWERHRVPGEKAHKQLRWNVRAQMLRRDDVVTVS
ncbi:unnamed protein product, partial [Ixodes hexagonus]